MGYIALATEDELSEAVGRRLSADSQLEVSQPFRRGGNGFLRDRLPVFCKIADHQPVLVLTDLDNEACPPALIGDWYRRLHRPPDLLLRVAVREVEAWLLADRDALADFLRISARHIPQQPERLDDPKDALLRAAMHAPRTIREELVARNGALASQGIGYNKRLSGFVEAQWSPERASASASSLARARQRIAELAARIA
jgi:hypothetical protein